MLTEEIPKARRGEATKEGRAFASPGDSSCFHWNVDFYFWQVSCSRYHILFLGIIWKSVFGPLLPPLILVCQILSQVWSANRRWLAKRSNTFFQSHIIRLKIEIQALTLQLDGSICNPLFSNVCLNLSSEKYIATLSIFFTRTVCLEYQNL